MAFRYLCPPPTQSLKPFFSLEYSQMQQATNSFAQSPIPAEKNKTKKKKNTKKQKKAYPYFVFLYTNTRFSLSLLKVAKIPQCEPKDSQVGSLSKFLLFQGFYQKKKLRLYSTLHVRKHIWVLSYDISVISYSIDFFSILINLSPTKRTTSPSIGHVWFNVNFYGNLFLCWELRKYKTF